MSKVSPFWLETIKQIIATSQTGLGYKNNPYDAERFEFIKKKCYELLEKYADADFENLENIFYNEKAYVTPKVDVRGVVFRENEILLVQEAQDQLWTIPGGWADVGYSPFEIAIKETKEESGIEVVPVRLIAVMDKTKHSHPPSPFYIYKFFILCKETGGVLKSSNETLDARFFNIANLPPLSTERTTKEQIEIMYDYYLNPEKPVWCD